MSYSKAYQLFVWNHEGGYVNHPKDPGGHTNRGVTLATWSRLAPSLVGKPGTLDTLKNITFSEWDKILGHYYSVGTYYGEIKSQPIAEWATELMWGSGGIWDLQRAYNRLVPHNRITVDGVAGPQTVNAINNYTHPNGQENADRTRLLLDTIYDQRLITLRSIRHPVTGELQYKTFPGWFTRAANMHELQKKNVNGVQG